MRRRRKLLIAFGAALGALILIAWIYHWHLKSGNEAYIAELVARGEPMRLAQVLPPPVPPAGNSADLFLQVTALLAADSSLLHTDVCHAMLTVTPGKAAVCSQLPEMMGYDSTNPWPVLAQALAKNQTTLDLLQQITERPVFDVHIQYESGLEGATLFTNLHLIELRKSEEYLRAAVINSLHDGNVAAAVRYQRASLALVKATQNQRLQISQWVRMAMVYGVQSSCWEILQSPGVTETQLAALQHDWEELDFVQSSLAALTMERAVGQITLAHWRSSVFTFGQYLGLGKSVRETMGIPDDSESLWDRIQTNAKIFLWRYWWSYTDELRALKGDQVLLEASRFMTTNASFQTALANQEAGLAALQITNFPGGLFMLMFDDVDFHSLLSRTVVILSESNMKVMIAETTRQMTITAIALQRFKLAHGHFPDHLSELTPKYVKTAPLDFVDGQSLRYRLQPTGIYLLYSVGENGVDDGGNPAPADHATFEANGWLSHQALDWVWPQPATR